MKEAASDARNRIAAATSSGRPMRPNGCMPSMARRAAVSPLADRPVDHRGLDGAGRDRVDADTVAGDLQRGGLGQAFHGVLAGHVGGAGLEADVSGHGTDVDDGAAAGAAEGGDLVLEAPEHALGVDLEHAAYVAVGLVLEPQGLVAFRPRVVHRDVEAAEGFQGQVHGRDGIGLAGMVGGEVARLGAGGLHGREQGGAALRLEVGPDDPVAGPGEGEGGGEADSGGGTGDEDDGRRFHVRDFLQ